MEIQISTISFKWLIQGGLNKHLESRFKALKNKMILQNIMVKSNMSVSWNEKHFSIVQLRIRVLVEMELTTEKDNPKRL